MIGHDLVAWPLRLPSRMGTQRWSQKVLTASEFQWQNQQNNPTRAAASLWAAKEAAYKLSVKLGATRLFRPKVYEVDFGANVIRWRQQPGLFFRLKIVTLEGGPVCCIAAEKAKELRSISLQVKKQKASDPFHQSVLAREFALEQFTRTGMGQDVPLSIELIGNGYPALFQGNKRLPIDLSLSHDGEWISVAWVKNTACQH